MTSRSRRSPRLAHPDLSEAENSPIEAPINTSRGRGRRRGRNQTRERNYQSQGYVNQAESNSGNNNPEPTPQPDFVTRDMLAEEMGKLRETLTSILRMPSRVETERVEINSSIPTSSTRGGDIKMFLACKPPAFWVSEIQLKLCVG